MKIGPLYFVCSFPQIQLLHLSTGDARHPYADKRFVFCGCLPYLAQVMEVGESCLQCSEECCGPRARVELFLALNVGNVHLAKITKLKRLQRNFTAWIRSPIEVVREIKSRFSRP